MDFYKALDTDSSRLVGEIVTEAVGNNLQHFKEVMDIALNDIPKISSRAGRVVLLCSIKYPDLLISVLDEVIGKIPELKNHGALRTLLKVLTTIDISDHKHLSILLENCFKFLTDNDYPVAIKIYSMEILFRICTIEPDLKYELISVIEDQVPKNSNSFKAKARHILKELR